MQDKRKGQEHELPMTTTAVIIHTAAPAGPRTLALAQLTADDARCRALFASSLQRSDAPGAGAVAEAIRVTARQLGTDGCTGRMAQEFGDPGTASSPSSAAPRWARGYPAIRLHPMNSAEITSPSPGSIRHGKACVC